MIMCGVCTMFSNLDKKATIKNARLFLENDFPKIQRYASYEDLLASPTIDGQPKEHDHSNPDDSFIKHASNKRKLDLITKAMSTCTGDGSFILKQKYLDNRLAYITRTRLNISHSTYSCHLNQALIEFADCLYFLTRNCGDEIIDLRVKKDQTKQA